MSNTDQPSFSRIRQNQRQSERTQLMYYLRVWDQANNSLFGHVIDVSSEGMLLTSHKKLENHRTYQLALEDIGVLEESGAIPIVAECRWTKGDPDTDLMDGGFRFVQVTDKARELLENYME